MTNKKISIDIGCGAMKKEDHYGFDRRAVSGVDVVCDIVKGLPLRENSVDAVFSSHAFEHAGDTVYLFEELYRVCTPGATVRFIVPYYMSSDAFRDPTHKSFYSEETLFYFTDGHEYQRHMASKRGSG